jgi:adenylate cyclase
LSFGLATALVLPFLGTLRATLVTLVLVMAMVTINIFSWSHANLVLPLASQILIMALLFAFNVPYRFLAAIRAERRITALFGQYVPPDLCTLTPATSSGFLSRALKGESDSPKAQR